MKKNDRIPKKNSKNSGHRTGVLLEEIRQQVQIVAEGHGAIMRKLGEHDKQFEKIGLDVDILKTDVGTLKTDVGTLKTDVGTLKTDVGTLKTDVGTLKTDVGILKTDVGVLKTDVGSLRSKVDSMESELHYVKVAVLETNQTVQSIEKKLDNHEVRITKLEEKVHI